MKNLAQKLDHTASIDTLLISCRENTFSKLLQHAIFCMLLMSHINNIKVHF